VLSGGDDVVHVPGQGLFGQAEGEAGRRLRGHVCGPGQRVTVDQDVNHDRPVFMGERGSEAVAQVAGFLDADAGGAERFGDAAEVGVREVGPERMKPASCCSMLTKSSIPLFKTIWTTGAWRCTWVSRSPSPSMVKPPSPHKAIVCRPGKASCAPNALGAALAIDATRTSRTADAGRHR
jgi:hypothetical protein